MRLVVVLALAFALVGSGAALAARGDPQEKINPADQARARAMLLRKADLGLSFQAQPSGGANSNLECPALDESDLTLTGKAESSTFTGSFTFASSEAQIYESVADANASWRRGTSAAGTACLRDGLRREFAKEGLKLVSLRKIAFPRIAQKSAAYRIALAGQSQSVTVRVILDVIVLMHLRAQVGVFIGSLVPPNKDDELRLGRLTAGRMAKAMRTA